MKEVGANMFLNYTVRDCTFDGIVDPMIEAALEQDFIELPIPFDRFGWFYPVSLDSMAYTVQYFPVTNGIGCQI